MVLRILNVLLTFSVFCHLAFDPVPQRGICFMKDLFNLLYVKHFSNNYDWQTCHFEVMSELSGHILTLLLCVGLLE